jgi:hypothetical protein
MVTKPTGRKRGRPKGTKKDFRTDPDRVAIAYAWQLMPYLPENSFEDKAYRSAALFFILPLDEVILSKDTPELLGILKRKPGLQDKPLGAAVTRLRQKAHRWFMDDEAKEHVLKLAAMIRLSMAVKDKTDWHGIHMVETAAKLAGEEELFQKWVGEFGWDGWEKEDPF